MYFEDNYPRDYSLDTGRCGFRRDGRNSHNDQGLVAFDSASHHICGAVFSGYLAHWPFYREGQLKMVFFGAAFPKNASKRTIRGAPTGISTSMSFQHPFNRAGGRTSNVIQKMNRFFLAATFFCFQCAWGIELRVPEGWSQMEVPSGDVPYKMPPTIRPMIRLLSPNKDGSASIAEMRRDVSLDEAAKSYARGMPMRGFTIKSTAKIIQNGHEGRHIKGHLSIAGRPDRIPVEVYIIMTQECILIVEVVGTKAANDVLSWIAFKPVKGTPNK